MRHDNKKNRVIQANVSPQYSIRIAQQEWLQALEILELERKEAGFDTYSIEELLSVVFDEEYGLEKQSHLIEVQEKYRILEERKKLLWS